MQLVAIFLHIDIQSPSNGDLFVACLLEIFYGYDDSNQKGYSTVQLAGGRRTARLPAEQRRRWASGLAEL